MHDAADDCQCLPYGTRTEKNERERKEQKCNRHLHKLYPQRPPVNVQKVGNFQAQRHQEFTDHLIHAVQSAPDHIRHIRAMPETADKKDNHTVELLSELSFPAPAEGNV